MIVALVGGIGLHLSRSAQVKPRIVGMSDEWSTQRARSVRVRAVLAMHLPYLGIHTLWHFPCACLTPCFSPQIKKKVIARACLAVALK